MYLDALFETNCVDAASSIDEMMIGERPTLYSPETLLFFFNVSGTRFC
jgi:hypothetical protein